MRETQVSLIAPGPEWIGAWATLFLKQPVTPNATGDIVRNLIAKVTTSQIHVAIPTTSEICYTIRYMAKITPTHPMLLLLYGYPGAGKTYFARQLCERIQTAHLQGDRIRGELLERPRYDKQENEIIM